MTTSEQHAALYRKAVVCILVVAAVLRFWYLSEVVKAPDFMSLRQDMSVQDYQARAMLSGDWTVPEGRSDPEIPTTPYYRPPGYSYLLAVIYFLSGGSYLAPRLFNIGLGLISILLMAHLGRILFGKGVALITALIMAGYWGFIYYEGEVNDPAVFVFLLPCLLLTLRRWGTTRLARWAALAGIITGCYALMRPNILLYGPLMAAWMLFLEWRSGKTIRTWRAWVALAGATALVIAPVTLRNYRVSGEFVPISTYFGENLLIGNNEYADGHTSWTPYLQQLEGTGQFSVWEYAHIVHGLAREVGNVDLTHSEASTIFTKKALDWIRHNKMATLKLALKKAVLFWSPQEITENKVVHHEKEHYPPLKYMPGFSLLFALFLGGVLLMLKDRIVGASQKQGQTRHAPDGRSLASVPVSAVSTGDMLLLFYGLLLSYYLSFLPFFVNARARHPITGLMALVAAYGIHRMWLAWKQGESKKLAAMALLLVACYGLAQCEPWPYTPDKARWHYARADSWLRVDEVEKAAAEAEALLQEDYSYYMPFRLGHAFAVKGRHALAARLLQKSLSDNPEDQPDPYRQDVYFHIGVALAADKQYEAAKNAFLEALRLNLNDARAHNDLGVLLEKEGQYESALEHYRAAVTVRPDFALAQSNLCDLLGRMGERDAAIAACEAAVAAAPESANCNYNLAVQLAAAERMEEAAAQYRATISMAPADVRALNNLALLLEGQGNNEEAESLLRRAVAIDPGFALARANLANLCVKTNRVEEGLALYLEGLELAPNDSELLNGIAYQYAHLDMPEKARPYYEAALRNDPEYDRARINLFRLCLQIEDWEEALTHLAYLITKYPADAQLHLEMGGVYAQLGDVAKAAAAYRHALELDPNLEEARKRLQAMETSSGTLE
jgi:tetratricopeptide (TPR) repeat protein